MDDWFTIEQIDEQTHVISEYRHWEETHCYLISGTEQSLLIDTGLGIGNIYHAVKALTGLPVAAAATHIHWDHVGGLRFFPNFYAHEKELGWLNGAFPLPLDAVKKMVTQRCDLPADFDVNAYSVFQGTPTRLLSDGDEISLGGRSVQVFHTPGHSPGHLCFWEAERGYLFTGDLVYQGTLFANYPSTDPAAYLSSLETIASLPAKRIFPAHHTLAIEPEIIIRMRDAFRGLAAEGLLHHGSGTFDYGDWAIQL